MLVAYGIAASYIFGLIMNLWYWPFAVGMGTDISYSAGAPIGQNLASFGLYSLVSSTLTWDTVRAITTVVGIALVGRAALAALRRAKLGRPAHTLKYFASGWWNTNASVDCSGCSCSSSDSSTPIRSGFEQLTTLRRSSMSGHAG